MNQINMRHCVTCGGVTQYEEFNPTVTAAAGNRVVERPDPNTAWANTTVTGPTTVQTFRWCGCPKVY